MNAEEAYQFENSGFIVLRQCLEPELVAELLAVANAREQPVGGQLYGSERNGGTLHWSKGFRDLLDVPRVSAVLEDICGDRTGQFQAPSFRIDHINVHTHPPGVFGYGLHGGNRLLDGTPMPSQYYKKDGYGRFHNGLVSVTFELEDTFCNDGGFACIPGSHRTPGPVPEDWRDLSKGIHPVVQRVPAAAGDAIIFTEALVHATLPWTASSSRTTLFYKYTPRSLAWASEEDFFHPEDTAQYADMDERKAAIVSPPPPEYIEARRKLRDLQKRREKSAASKL